eukprot:scaffold6268_cov119-Skeletonema_menzelii.AAC.4
MPVKAKGHAKGPGQNDRTTDRPTTDRPTDDRLSSSHYLDVCWYYCSSVQRYQQRSYIYYLSVA